jgi:hypothetical protein
MNLTIFSLTVLKDTSTSPILMMERTRKATIKNLMANKFFSNCIYANQGTSFNIISSTFTKSLSSAIRYASKDINSSTYSLTLILYDDSSVVDCFFSYCFSPQKGGAIQASPNTISLSVISSNFIHCLASTNGGGIYINANALNVSKCCFINCTAYSYGQAISVESQNKQNVCIQDTIAFRCSTREKRRSAAAYFVEGVNTIIEYNNHTRCVTTKSAAVITALTGIISIKRCNIINCTSINILELMYLDDSIYISFCNFIANKVSKVTPVIIVSRNTTIENCYLEGNSTPFIDRSPGPATKILFSNCLYDTLGLKQSVLNELSRCINIGPKDVTYAVSPRGKNYCFYMGQDKSNIFEGFKPFIFIIISSILISVHITLLHPSFFRETFSTFISGDKKTRARRRRAAIYSNRLN